MQEIKIVCSGFSSQNHIVAYFFFFGVCGLIAYIQTRFRGF